MPGVVGDKQADAEKAMKEAGFKTDVREETSDTVNKGRVISTSAAARTRSSRRASTVVLVVSERAASR